MRKTPLPRRRAPLRSPGTPARKTRVRSSNPKKKAANWLRAFESVERVNWIAGQLCCACQYARNCENHHVKNGGRGRKADARFIVPLCFDCHEMLHRIGRVTFEEVYGVDLEQTAERTHAAWLAYSGEAA